MKTLTGRIQDITIAGRGVQVQMIEGDGQVQTLRDEFIPGFYVGGGAKDLRALARFVIEQPWEVRLARTKFTDPALKHPIDVLQVEVMNPHHFQVIVERLRRARPKLKYYYADVPVVSQYVTARGILPFVVSHIVIDDEQRILGIETAASSHHDSSLPTMNQLAE